MLWQLCCRGFGRVLWEFSVNAFFCYVAKALCTVTKAPSAEDNDGEGDRAFLSGYECVPLPRSQRSVQSGPPTKNARHSIKTYQVTLCSSRSLYRCHTSVPLTYSRWSEADPRTLCCESNESHPLVVICRVGKLMVITFNHSDYH